MHLTETIKEALDQDRYCRGIFVDKAFDNVDQHILLGKLKQEYTYSWCESYLKDRKQYV